VYGVAQEIPERDILRSDIGISDYDVKTLYKISARKDPLAVSVIGQYGYYFPLLDANMTQLYGLREIAEESQMLPPPLDYYATHMTTKLNKEDIGFSPAGHRPIPKDLKLFKYSFYNLFNGNDAKRQRITDFMISTKRDRLWRWTRYNHVYQSGLLTARGRDVRVGSKVSLPDEESRGITFDPNGNRKIFKGMEYYCTDVIQQWSFGTAWLTQVSLVRGHNPIELRSYHDVRKFNQRTNTDNHIFTAETPGTL
jgi:hypothetical protein